MGKRDIYNGYSASRTEDMETRGNLWRGSCVCVWGVTKEGICVEVVEGCERTRFLENVPNDAAGRAASRTCLSLSPFFTESEKDGDGLHVARDFGA